MFFRRRRSPPPPTFEQRLEALCASGFTARTQPDGRASLSRDGCGALVEAAPGGGAPRLLRAGLLIGGDIALLVDGGFQKFWQTPDGRRSPALADQLKALHSFEEDLREALGMVSLYNTSLGTINDLHLYDRLQGRGGG